MRDESSIASKSPSPLSTVGSNLTSYSDVTSITGLTSHCVDGITSVASPCDSAASEDNISSKQKLLTDLQAESDVNSKVFKFKYHFEPFNK